MARELANIRLDIWTSQDFRDLTQSEQRLYFLLLTHDSLSYCGVADWRPRRLAQLATDTSAADIERTGEGLQSKRFILIDDETEEVMVRSFLKHDGLLKQPRLSVSMVNAYGATTSRKIRAVIVHELDKLDKSDRDLVGLRHDRIRRLLEEPSSPIDAFISSDDCPPISPGFGPNVGQGLGLHTATATSTSTLKTVTLGSNQDEEDKLSLLEPEVCGPSIEDQFDVFWSHWPRKVKKPEARDAFSKAVKEKRATPLQIIDAAADYSKSDLPEKPFIPHPATWLNNDQWNDLDPANGTQSGTEHTVFDMSPEDWERWEKERFG